MSAVSAQVLPSILGSHATSRRAVKRSRFFQGATAVSFLIVVLIRLAVKLDAVELGYAMASEQREHLRLRELERELDLQESVAFRPDRIQRLAAQKLGMATMSKSQVILIK